MTDTANDKPKPSHGILWYSTWLLMLYVTSYPLAMLFVFWLHLHRSFNNSPVAVAIWKCYSPVQELLNALGLLGPLARFIDSIAQMLP